MYEKGLQQGRMEGGEALAEELKEQAKQQGHEEGHAEGYQEGKQQGVNEGLSVIEQQKLFMANLNQELAAYERLLSTSQIQQSAQLLERLLVEVVRGELKLAPDHILNLVKQASSMMDRSDKTAIRVHVHPNDLVWLEPLKLSDEADYLFLANQNITKGGCRIEGELGEVDAEIETRIKLCIEQFRNNLLDDPEHAPEPDLSPLYDADPIAQPETAIEPEEIEPSKQPAPPSENKPARQTESSASADAQSDSGSFSFKPTAEAAERLGAWGSLGQ